ncbi:hypothetical protein NQ314_006011 [Rhamnusium bicolor]|uniref:CHHC U11-48K-type domain-containing protein n=1 Tax=Rhamnusium bicolor TaxID=1586634 RepID=A0AAV8ZBQ8_9CUCU|nr:hypothetical protein NQ314_006011 [Rhamnusium bicolor]
MEILHDPEEKIMCPYNPSHHIRRYRMNVHLVKCKKSYPESKLVECDFNVNHKIPEPELQYHHENCPDRKKIEVTIYQEEGSVINRFPIPNIEDNVQTYDPAKYCEQNEVIRHVDVESAAKRKNFRLTERQRINQLTVNKPSDRLENNRPSNVNKNASALKRNLPEKSRVVVQEDTPASVEDILKRLE